jgi:prepilin-type N-terminal cleavage/methylation domain-containing protein
MQQLGQRSPSDTSLGRIERLTAFCAFTLIELLVVIAIIGVLAALIMKNPAYQDPNYNGGGAWMGTLAFVGGKEGGLCKGAEEQMLTLSATGNRQASADQAWVRWTQDEKTMTFGSYGYNG